MRISDFRMRGMKSRILIGKRKVVTFKTFFYVNRKNEKNRIVLNIVTFNGLTGHLSCKRSLQKELQYSPKIKNIKKYEN